MFVCGFTGAAHAQSPRMWTVSPAGNDGNAGTDTAPLLTLQRAADVVNPGDTVVVPTNVAKISRVRTFLDWSQVISSFGVGAAGPPQSMMW